MTRFMNTKAWKEQLWMFVLAAVIYLVLLSPILPPFAWFLERAGDFAAWVWPW